MAIRARIISYQTRLFAIRRQIEVLYADLLFDKMVPEGESLAVSLDGLLHTSNMLQDSLDEVIKSLDKDGRVGQ